MKLSLCVCDNTKCPGVAIRHRDSILQINYKWPPDKMVPPVQIHVL